MEEVKDDMQVYSITDKPGDYRKILSEPYDVLINNSDHFDSLIEVVIPTFQRSKLLREALKSALHQDTNDNFLITIIDNDPNTKLDSLSDLYEYRSRIRYIRNRNNLGLFGNLNRSLQIASAPYIALLHDDDLLESDYILKLTKIINLYNDVGVITHDPYQLIDGIKLNPYSSLKKKIIKGSIKEVDWKEYLFGNVTNASAMLINRDKAIGLGGWNHSEFPSADWFFNARMAFRFQVLRYYMPISTYRWEVNTSLQNDVRKKFTIADTWFILSNLDSELPISRKLRFLAEVSAFRKIEVDKNLGEISIPGLEYIVNKFKNLNKFSYFFLLIYRRLYIKSRNLIILKRFKRFS
jgi:glycosyltransferase involved in cell wall biosynthesis